MALAREQITIVDLHDGVDGSTYSLNILGGTRTISYNATGKSPTPAQAAYSCELYKDGVKVTPSSYAWSASGHLSGTSTAAGFTPTVVPTYNASLTSSNVVSLTAAYKGMVFKGTVQVVVTKAATDAKLITLVADSQVFKVVGKTVSPTTAKITAETQNTSVTAWTYSSNGAAFTSTLPAGVARSGSTVTITGASMTAQTIAVKASDGTYSDVMTIVKVADGKEGKSGAPAVQPVTGFLTNESVTFPADFNGNVTGHTGPLGSFKVFQGTTDVTASASFTASNNVGGVVSISSTGVYTLNSLAADRASVDLKAVYGGVSIIKTLTISKSRAGAPGRAVDKIDVMYYSSTSSTDQINGSWSTNAPAWVNGRFIWSKTVTTYSEGLPATTSSLPILLTGATGNTGRGIKSITEQYALTSNKDTAPSQGSSLWKDAAPTWTSGNYMWTRSKIVYLNSDGSETTSYVGVSVDTAWEAVNEIEVGGRNLIGHFNIVKGGWVAASGDVAISSIGRVATDFIAIPINTKNITFNYNGEDYPSSSVKVALGLYDVEFGFIERLTSTNTSTPKTFTLPENVAYIRLSYPTELRSYDDYAKLEKGNIATDWTPAPEDIEETLVSHDARIDTNEREIALRATKEELRTLKNLIPDPYENGGILGGWGGTGLTVSNVDFLGSTIPVLQSRTASNIQNYSPYFKVDPRKAYEISFWAKSEQPTPAGTNFYFGINAINASSATLGVIPITKAAGAVGSLNTNFYFATVSGAAALNEWTKFVGYILPAGTTGEEGKGLGSSYVARNASMTPGHDRIRIRFLNWSNTTTRSIWVARPTVKEVPSGMATDFSRRVSSAELKVTPGAITSTVRSSTDYINDQGKKVSTNEIISKINQSAEKIQIEASKINIKGKVTFESFDSSTAAEINSKARTFTSTPVPPYSLGDIWKNSTSTYMCKVARATGSYVASDWEKTGDVTSANKAADTAKVGGTAATTVVTGATAGSAAKTATDRWTYTGKTTINGGQIQADTVTATQIKAKTITASEIAANTITVNQLASSVGSSLDLSSNTAITSRVTSTQLSTALNGKEDSIFKQSSAPSHKVGRLWLDTSTDPNQLKRSDGTKWVIVNDVQVGGRNLLFNLKSLERTVSGVTLTYSNGKITLNGTCTTSFNFSKALSIDGGIYTLSANNPETAPNAGTRIDVYGATTGTIVGDMSKVYASTTRNLNAGTASLRIRVESGTTYTNFELTPKLEKGNIATDWTPAPEDIQAEIDTIAGEVGDVRDAVTDLDEYIDIAFHDGIIGEVEARTIEKYLNIVNSEKSDVDAKYTKLYANTLLAGTAKTGLYSAKSTYNTAHTNLISAINTAIRGGTATNAEKTNVDAKFTAYRTALTNLSTAFETASAYLVSAVNGRFDGPTGVVKRLTEAESKVTDDAIIGTVSERIDSDGKPLFAKTSEVKQTVDTWTAKFSSIGGENLYEYSENLLNRFSTFDGSAWASGYPRYVDVPEYNVNNAVHLRSTGVGNTVMKLYTTVVLAENLESGEPYTMSFYIKNNRTDQYMEVRSNRWPGIERVEAGETKRIIFSGVGSGTGNAQIQLRARGVGYYIDCALWHVKLERGWVATEYDTKLYTGITKINRDGVTVGREGETIESNFGFDGVRINDGATEIASFTGSGAVMNSLEAESITGDVINIMDKSMTFNIGTGSGYYADFSEVLKAVGNRKYINDGIALVINVRSVLNEDIRIFGFSGGGMVDINIYAKVNGSISTGSNQCMVRVLGKSGNLISRNGTVLSSASDSYVYFSGLNVDGGSSTGNGVGASSGSRVYVEGCDFVNVKDGIYSSSGATIQALNNRGNIARYANFASSGRVWARGTVPNAGNYGFVYEADTTKTASSFSPPPTTTFNETRTFNHTDIYTYSVKYGARSTHYGKAAAQNRWDTSMTQMKGRISFGSSVYSFIAGRNSGTTPTVKIRLRRQNSSHGSSSSVKPTPEWSGAPSFGGATRGNWTAWVTIPYTLFTSSGYTFSFYNGTTGDSYAIWDRAEVQITRRVTQ